MKNYDVTDLEAAFKGFVINGGVTDTVYDARPKATVAAQDRR